MKNWISVLLLFSIISTPYTANADVAGLTPCKESKDFQRRLDGSVKKLTTRLAKYEVGTPPALALEKQIEKTKSRFDRYGKAGLLFWDVDFSVSGSGTLTYNGSTYNSKTFLQVDGSDPFIGLGLSYEISKNTSFAFDYITTASTNAIEGVAFGLSGYSISWLRSF